MSETKKRDGGPAFPEVARNIEWQEGMTLRDWFAGQALVGLLSSETAWRRAQDAVDRSINLTTLEWFTRTAQSHAIAMVEARDA